MTKREELNAKIEELENELAQLDDDDELIEFRKSCQKMKKQLDIMKEETGLDFENFKDILIAQIKKGDYYD